MRIVRFCHGDAAVYVRWNGQPIRAAPPSEVPLDRATGSAAVNGLLGEALDLGRRP